MSYTWQENAIFIIPEEIYPIKVSVVFIESVHGRR